MSLAYYTRERDLYAVVYEVDFEAGTWRILDAEPGQENASGQLVDGGKAFDSVYFCRLEVIHKRNSMTLLVPARTIH